MTTIWMLVHHYKCLLWKGYPKARQDTGKWSKWPKAGPHQCSQRPLWRLSGGQKHVQIDIQATGAAWISFWGSLASQSQLEAQGPPRDPKRGPGTPAPTEASYTRPCASKEYVYIFILYKYIYEYIYMCKHCLEHLVCCSYGDQC